MLPLQEVAIRGVLLYLEMSVIQRIIVTCCILHNLFTVVDLNDETLEPRGHPVTELLDETTGGNELRRTIQQRMFSAK